MIRQSVYGLATRSCVFQINARERALGRDSSLRGERQRRTDIAYSEHPATSIRFDESPLSEYRPFQDRGLMRRLFDSKVTRFARPLTLETADQKIRKL
jgi:hypothetical protein